MRSPIACATSSSARPAGQVCLTGSTVAPVPSLYDGAMRSSMWTMARDAIRLSATAWTHAEETSARLLVEWVVQKRSPSWESRTPYRVEQPYTPVPLV